MNHPFADLIELRVDEQCAGSSTLSLTVIYALADTGMGSALYPTLAAGEICATIEIKINYFKPIATGHLVCNTQVVNRGKTVANLESRIYLEKVLVAQANGNYAIFRPRNAEA